MVSYSVRTSLAGLRLGSIELNVMIWPEMNCGIILGEEVAFPSRNDAFFLKPLVATVYT